jgi:hypothetical protein
MGAGGSFFREWNSVRLDGGGGGREEKKTRKNCCGQFILTMAHRNQGVGMGAGMRGPKEDADYMMSQFFFFVFLGFFFFLSFFQDALHMYVCYTKSGCSR